jgi:UMF1 family MFS transporter
VRRLPAPPGWPHNATVTTDAGSSPAPAAASRRSEQRGWAFYDWANSAYSATVTTVLFGPYVTTIARNAACGVTVTDDVPCPVADPQLQLAGLTISPESYYPFLLALSIVGQVVVLPLAGALADRTAHKKRLLAASAYLGAAATAAMYFLVGERYLLGGALFLVAQASFGASMVVYNAYLPEIADPDERDRLSARGWALGYLGGGLLLAANVALLLRHDDLGLSQTGAVRVSLLSAGVWWAAFTLIPLRTLRDRPRAGHAATGSALAQLRATLADARSHPGTLRFLAAYLVYNDGIQTVIGLAGVYGVTELALSQVDITVAILIVQFVAFLGALLLGRIARRHGAKNVILGSLCMWALVLVGAFGISRGSAVQFLVLAVAIGLVLGGSQALSRSLFSQLIPRGREAEYFSLYEISERGTSWLGALLVGVVQTSTGSYRYAILCLVAFFAVGFLLLRSLDVRAAIAAVGNEQPERV